jgi:aspartyl-tRNA(Asn)/glutamyl-tRNA(Gln) amidotransferase subunit C
VKITEQEVRHVADLANLALTDEEIVRMTQDMDGILTHIDKLNELDTSGIEPLTQVVAAAEDDSALREDVIVRADIITEVLQGAPDPEAPYFRVPRVIEK